MPASAARAEDAVVDGDGTRATEQDTEGERARSDLGGRPVELDEIESEGTDLDHARPGTLWPL